MYRFEKSLVELKNDERTIKKKANFE